MMSSRNLDGHRQLLYRSLDGETLSDAEQAALAAALADNPELTAEKNSAEHVAASIRALPDQALPEPGGLTDRVVAAALKNKPSPLTLVFRQPAVKWTAVAAAVIAVIAMVPIAIQIQGPQPIVISHRDVNMDLHPALQKIADQQDEETMLVQMVGMDAVAPPATDVAEEVYMNDPITVLVGF